MTQQAVLGSLWCESGNLNLLVDATENNSSNSQHPPNPALQLQLHLRGQKDWLNYHEIDTDTC